MLHLHQGLELLEQGLIGFLPFLRLRPNPDPRRTHRPQDP